MKNYTFRISQDLLAYYNAKVTIKANNAKIAKNKLEQMTTRELDEIAFDWEQITNNASPIGDITVQELIKENGN